MHKRLCLTEAIIRATCDLRDMCTDFEFRIAMQNNEALQRADKWLEDTDHCVCYMQED